VIGWRHADARHPFFWERPRQPPGRWHGEGEGPTQYLADTPDGAWAEFLRHEEIVEPGDLAGVRRALWAVDVGDPPAVRPDLDDPTLTGDLSSWAACQAEARRLRASGADGLRAPSAALAPGAAGGWRTDDGLRPGPPADGRVIVLFGPRPDAVGWRAAEAARPSPSLLDHVRHLRP
jgi:RES domain